MELTGDGNITAVKQCCGENIFNIRDVRLCSPTLSKTIRHRQIPRVLLALVLWPDRIVLPTPRRPMFDKYKILATHTNVNCTDRPPDMYAFWR